jgi:hypothetical protein
LCELLTKILTRNPYKKTNEKNNNKNNNNKNNKKTNKKSDIGNNPEYERHWSRAPKSLSRSEKVTGAKCQDHLPKGVCITSGKCFAHWKKATVALA